MLYLYIYSYIRKIQYTNSLCQNAILAQSLYKLYPNFIFRSRYAKLYILFIFHKAHNFIKTQLIQSSFQKNYFRYKIQGTFIIKNFKYIVNKIERLGKRSG